VTYQSEANPDRRFHQLAKGDPVIGRFGLKARLGTLDDFSADAAQGDMGLTSPLRPVELSNPSGASDRKPGADLSLETINKMANYIRMLGIPRRGPLPPRGAQLFAQVGCAGCHTPSLKTRADYPVAPIAGIDAPVYTDLLLHDMGDALADGLGPGEGDAGPREWRTTPLIGLRFDRTLMHDGRAATVEEAVIAHEGPGSQANVSVARWRALPAADRAVLLAFVEAL
ncbi:MAG TPA: di-heme oxidoredictase family protein, partial [Polyangiaceae bacterium]|nr:di-heme oxidoredictase family protein [Polyangiaceae bacterium]